MGNSWNEKLSKNLIKMNDYVICTLFHVNIGIMNNNRYIFSAPNHQYEKHVSVILIVWLFYRYNFIVPKISDIVCFFLQGMGDFWKGKGWKKGQGWLKRRDKIPQETRSNLYDLKMSQKGSKSPNWPKLGFLRDYPIRFSYLLHDVRWRSPIKSAELFYEGWSWWLK